MGDRKPAWLRLIAPDRNPQKLTPVKCSGCGRWCIEQHGATQWDKWDAGHLRLDPPKRPGRHHDGTPFALDPTCKITRRGLTLLYQRIGAERMRDQLHYTDTQYPFDEEI